MTTVAAALGVAIFLGMRTQPAQVETAQASFGPMEITVEEEGKTRLRDRFVVSAPLAGIMRRHDWKIGDTIPAGRSIMYLSPLRAEILDMRRLSESEARLQSASAAREGADARLRSAQEQLKAAEADAEYSKSQLAREEKLLAAGDIPASRLDRTRAEAKRAEAMRQAAEQAIAMAQAEISRSRAEVEMARAAASNPGAKSTAGAQMVPIYSPVGGRVVQVVRQSEGVVASGDPLLVLGNTRALEVEVELLSSDAVRIGPGTRLRLTRWGGEGSLEARVRLVEPVGFTKLSALGVEEQRVRVISDLVSPEETWRRLGEGYRVEAAFTLWSGDRVLQIPASALFRDGEKWAAFVVGDGFARKRIVEVGHRNGLTAEVIGGLKEGERVIPHPDDKLSDGVSVEIVEAKPR